MSCEYKGCTQTCRGNTSGAEEYCNVLRAYKKGVEDGKLLISDVQVEVSDKIEAEIRAEERKKFEKVISEIKGWLNSGNRGSCDYFIVDKIEETIAEYEKEQKNESKRRNDT